MRGREMSARRNAFAPLPRGTAASARSLTPGAGSHSLRTGAERPGFPTPPRAGFPPFRSIPHTRPSSASPPDFPGGRRTMSKLPLLLACAAALATAARADDIDRQRLDNWHQWRGPEADGTAPKADPPLTWDAKTNIKWKAELPGRG